MVQKGQVMSQTILKLGHTGRDQANKDEVLAAAIHKLVILVTGDEKHGAAAHLSPFAVLVYLALAGVDKNLVFPGMGVARGETTRGDSKDTHTKVVGAVFLADYDPAGDTFHCFAVELLGGTILVTGNLHRIFLDEY
jgi:hypothetical protein